jgi:hypothetical protein
VSVDVETTPIPCDVNHDGDVDGEDIQPFADYLILTSQPGWRDVCSGDLEATPNKEIDFEDVEPFVACLLGEDS